MTHERLPQGSAEWLEMAGSLMVDAATVAALPSDLNVSLVERYTDGAVLPNGLVQGIRFEITRGKPSFRIGAEPDEEADVTVEISARAARKLNMMRSTDPSYRPTRERFLKTGEMQVRGDAGKLGDWLEAVHDPIVDRTA